MADLREGLQQAVTDRTDEQLTRFGTALINLLSGQVNQTVNHSLTELKTQLLGKRPLSAPSETGRAAKTPKQTSAAAKPTPKKNDLADNFTLARKVGMCFGCGELYPQGAKGTKFDKTSMISHNKNCRKKFVKGVVTDEFLAAIAKWRNVLESGKSLNYITRAANEMRRK
jgi:hypothetical protein